MRIKTRFPHLLFALACVLFSAGCAVNPVTGKQNFTLMSEADEMRKGEQAAAAISKEYAIYDSPALQPYVNEVGQRLAKNSHRPQLDFHFTVVDSLEVNAPSPCRAAMFTFDQYSDGEPVAGQVKQNNKMSPAFAGSSSGSALGQNGAGYASNAARG